MDSTEFDTILNIIKNRRKLIKSPVLQFTYSFFPQDFCFKLDKIGTNQNVSIHNEVENVFSEFQQAWESAETELHNYKINVSNKIFSKERILADIQSFKKFVCKEQEKTSSYIITLTNVITNDSMLANAQQEILKMDKLFDMHFVEIQKKLNSLATQSDAIFFGRVLKEIDLNRCWLKRAHNRALFLFSNQLLSKISLITESITEHMMSICQEIEIKISELKTKVSIDTDALRSIEDFLRQCCSESADHLSDISEIKELQKMERELKERLHSLTDFHSIMKNFTEEKTQFKKKMDRADLDFKNKIENIMKNGSLLEEEKSEILNRCKDKHEKIVFEYNEAIRNIEESQAKLGQMLLSHERISVKDDLNKKLKEPVTSDVDELNNIIEEIEQKKTFHGHEKESCYIFYKDQKIYLNDFAAEPFPIPDVPQVIISDTQYLKEAVGTPLIKGLAQVVLHQPSDPVKYLAYWLINYRLIMNERKIKSKEMEELRTEKEWIDIESRSQHVNSAKIDTSPHCMLLRGEESIVDINRSRYNTPNNIIEGVDE